MGETSRGAAAFPRTSSRWSRLANRAYFVFFGCYLAGLVLWLVLGLVPSVALAIPALTREMESLAAGSGPFAGISREILLHRSAMPNDGWVALQYLFSALNLALGVLITLRRPNDLVPRLLALAFIGTAGTFNEASHVVFHLLENAPVVTAAHFSFHLISGVAYLWAVVLFPNGRLPLPRRSQRGWPYWAVGGAVTALILWICYRSSFIAHPPFFVAFFGVLVPVVGIAAQTTRLRFDRGDIVVQHQARLLRTALLPALAAAILWLGAHILERVDGRVGDVSATLVSGVQAAFPAVFAVVPVMLFVGILRYRLWDIDLVISRTLVYGMLAGFVVIAYAAVLALTGWLFQGQIWSTLLALMIVAVLAEPARQRSRELANRAVFGTVLTPRESMRVLAERLTSSSSTNELRELADLVVASTRCSSAQVWLVGSDKLMLAAASPESEATPVRALEESADPLAACTNALPGFSCVPISHDGRLLAVLALQTPPRVSIPSTENELIRKLAGHAGLLVANARLTTELAYEVDRVSSQAAELLRSRQQVVAAQDAERRRLERDIHDGAQQDLVAVLIQLRALPRVDPGRATAVLSGLRTVVQSARATIEELCRGGGPAVLGDAGLPAALEAAAATARRGGLRVDVVCSLTSRLASDTEAAIYFCCLEALQNSAKHAHPTLVSIEVVETADEVVLRVRDDGVGFEAADVVPGSGLTNLLERTAAVGGTVTVESTPGAGTATTCRVPAHSRSLAAGSRA